MNTPAINIGFARLSDCAMIAVAKEHGLFEKHGLDVNLIRYKSWAAMRDGLAHKMIDAAHMLSPMVVASAAGLGPYPGQFTTGFAFNLNGNAITVSNSLLRHMQSISPESMLQCPLSAKGLKHVVEIRKATGQPKLVFAHVYHFSMHAYELRYWLSAAGIDPDEDVELVVVPPAQMVDSLRAKEIDGYCVGEPWNTAAALAGLGHTLITSSEIWAGHIEKVLAVRSQWADANEDIHQSLIKALLEASIWLDHQDNRVEAAQLISSSKYVDAPLQDILSSLTGKNRQTGGNLRRDMPDFNIFHRYAANFPWVSQAKWILTQMVRWNQISSNIDFDKIARLAFRPNVYRQAALELNVATPLIDEKIEGSNHHAWILNSASQAIAMGADNFIDGRIFDPQQPEEYILNFQTDDEFKTSKMPAQVE
ncbi:CmpA/NrtA family ABC transporter substrate-binding protein [Hirschia litorea]|uniref:CmpA/NrtA family ABC transporter substrate-binding protein n=1 Tax=Hirschia litorea TaxID=1199156 RepID=A0ABW2II10_9PROT